MLWLAGNAGLFEDDGEDVFMIKTMVESHGVDWDAWQMMGRVQRDALVASWNTQKFEVVEKRPRRRGAKG